MKYVDSSNVYLGCDGHNKEIAIEFHERKCKMNKMEIGGDLRRGGRGDEG
jgi:hypothetical protein